MRLKNSIVIFSIAVTLLSHQAAASITFSYNPLWSIIGGVAGTCTFNIPTLSPLSVPRTLVVDNHLPNDSVLYSWSYSEFAPNFTSYCQPNGSALASSSVRFAIYMGGPYAYPYPTNYQPTNIPGIGLKYYTTMHYAGVNTITTSERSTEYAFGNSIGWFTPPAQINIESQLTKDMSVILYYHTIRVSTSSLISAYNSTENMAGFSIRAELVKTGPITYTTTPLSPRGTTYFKAIELNISNDVPAVLGSGGITIIPPACRLQSPTDYTINLGRWAHLGPGTSVPGIGLPANGPPIEIGLNLECSGKVDNVYFRFEDANAQPLANKNVSLYDSSGNKIDGLEVEMLYNGAHVNVDNTTKTDIGTQGTTRTLPADLAFYSQSTPPFSARFVQRSQILESGHSYTGPVSGKVNMFVTYQ